MRPHQVLLTVSCLWSCAALAEAQGDPPSYFRRDAGRAAGDRQALPDSFSSPGQLLWRQELPPGHSTPCVQGDSIYLTTYVEKTKELATLALDRAMGKVKWKRVAPAKKIEPFHKTGSPASCTVACDGKRVYAFFGSYGLLCYGLDGHPQWTVEMGPFQEQFGASSSPVLAGGKVILNEDHDIDSHLIAVDQETGKTAWKTPRPGFPRSYSTPVVWKPKGGAPQVIVAGALQLAGYDVKSGRKLWWVNGLSRIVDTTPVVSGGMVYLGTWTPGGDQTNRISMEPFPEAVKTYDKDGDGKIAKGELPPGAVLTRFFRIDLNQDQKLDKKEWDAHREIFAKAQNVALAVRPGGSGDVTKTRVKWIQRKGLPTVPSPVVYRGVMYMVKDPGIITSLDAETGAVLKQGRARGRGKIYASLVAGDGKVYVCGERGTVTVLRAGKEWDVLSSHDFDERIMATPVIAGGRFYLRTEEALYCFRKK